MVGFYTRPTPGEKNNRYTGAGVARGVIFSEASRAFNTSATDTLVNLSLAQAVPDAAAQILYTTGFSNLGSVRQQHTATALPGGGILITGGLSSVLLASSEIFNPAATNSLPAASLATARRLHTATALSNGKVLVVGGLGSSGALSTAELYDPAANAWSAAGSLATARQLHTATLLPTLGSHSGRLRHPPRARSLMQLLRLGTPGSRLNRVMRAPRLMRLRRLAGQPAALAIPLRADLRRQHAAH